MARIAGVDLPRNKRIEVAMTYIYGIGRSTSQDILSQAGVDLNTRTDDLTEAELARDYASIEALRAHPRIAKFIRWVARRPPDFHSKSPGPRRRRKTGPNQG